MGQIRMHQVIDLFGLYNSQNRPYRLLANLVILVHYGMIYRQLPDIDFR
jgi:hypothetical protein